jgi:phosphate transport system substrate-binding protein
MYSKKFVVILLTIAIIGVSSLVFGCTSSPAPTATPTGTAPTATPVANQTTASVIIGGSTTVQPLSELLAKAYMSNSTGNIKITVQGGGSGAGETGVGSGTLDIGSASEMVPASVMAKYPSIQTFTIGGSGVCVIVGTNVNAPANGYTVNDLAVSYVTGQPVANLSSSGVKELYTRAESSGTADSFGTYLFGSANKSFIYANATNNLKTAQGNDGVLAAVQNDPNGLAFVDFGFTENAKSIGIPAVQDAAGTVYTVSSNNIKGGLNDYFANKTSSAFYPLKMIRPLNYLTNGKPSSVIQDYINFAMSPNSEWAYKQVGYLSMQDINS